MIDTIVRHANNRGGSDCGARGAGGLRGFGLCEQGKQGSPGDEGSGPSSPEFDQKWSALAKEDVDVFYIEDDRGEGLMGNVRRARGAADAPATKGSDSPMPPAKLSHEDAQRVIKQNLAGVRTCFMRLGQGGSQRSGKAIVSFEIGPAGDVKDTKVDAPAFSGTSLPGLRDGDGVALGVPEVAEGRPGDQLPVRLRRRLGPPFFANFVP